MQAIQVKYLGPTNTKGSRYKAVCSSGSNIWNTDHSIDGFQNAYMAARELAAKLKWFREPMSLVSAGTLKNGDTVFMIVYKEEV